MSNKYQSLLEQRRAAHAKLCEEFHRGLWTLGEYSDKLLDLYTPKPPVKGDAK